MFDDPWLPRPGSFKMVTKGYDEPLLVKDLINGGRVWNDKVIDDKLSEVD